MSDNYAQDLARYLRDKRSSLNADVESFARFIGLKDNELSLQKIKQWEQGLSKPSQRILEFMERIPEPDRIPNCSSLASLSTRLISPR